MNKTYLFIHDLVFRSQVEVAAKHANIPVDFVAHPDEVRAADDTALAIFDLSGAKTVGTIGMIGLDGKRSGISQSGDSAPVRTGGLELLRLFREKFPDAKTLAFLPHIDEETRAAAETLGCTLILTRFEFTRSLGDILSRVALPEKS